MKLAISEVFYSLQGEGKTTGYPSVFVRLGGCNLMCGGMGTHLDGELHNGATWRCDTIEVWMKSQRQDFEDILPPDCEEAIRRGAHVILTGGEPLIQSEKVEKFIEYIRENYRKNAYIEVETNGTIVPNIKGVDQWNCSPKLSNSGNDTAMRFNRQSLEELNRLNTQFKFVISDQRDMTEVLEDFYFLNREKIWLMPAGENQELLSQTKLKTAEWAKRYNFKFTTRLHIDLWNKKTGV